MQRKVLYAKANDVGDDGVGQDLSNGPGELANVERLYARSHYQDHQVSVETEVVQQLVKTVHDGMPMKSGRD